MYTHTPIYPEVYASLVPKGHLIRFISWFLKHTFWNENKTFLYFNKNIKNRIKFMFDRCVVCPLELTDWMNDYWAQAKVSIKYDYP